jgi:hypothetical protein
VIVPASCAIVNKEKGAIGQLNENDCMDLVATPPEWCPEPIMPPMEWENVNRSCEIKAIIKWLQLVSADYSIGHTLRRVRIGSAHRLVGFIYRIDLPIADVVVDCFENIDDTC